MAAAAPVLSVVIATRDRPERLEATLRTLARQRPGDGAIEVVVVDDGSRHADAVERATRAMHARLIRIDGGGAGAARNAGTAAASSTKVAFIDDDVEPAADWARRIVAALDTADAVAGPTLNGLPDSALATASQLVSDAFVDPTAAATRTTRFAPSSNVACRRDVALANPFSDRFARTAAEDRDWCERLLRSGFTLTFDPFATVYHFQDLTPRRFWWKHVHYGRGAYAYRRLHRRGRLEPPRFYLGLVRAGFEHGAATGLSVCLAQLATGVGYAAEAVEERVLR